MNNLHRTQIYIGENQMHQLKLEAGKEHIAVSELIRRAIEFFFKTKEKRVNWERDPLAKAVGKIKLAVSNASVDHDHYLYGQTKRSPPPEKGGK